MADKRMFTKKVTDSDDFISLSSSMQALYLHLNQSADDDGFTNQVQMAMFKAHASVDDLKVLLAKRFVIQFESGVIVIKHWRMHNTLRKDRYTPTNFQEELNMLGIKKNGSYTLDKTQAVAERLPDGCQTVATGKVSIGEVSIGQDRVVEVSEEDSGGHFERLNGSLGKGVVMLTPEQDEVLLECLGFDAYNHYIDKLATFIIEKKAKVSNHYATIMKWAKEDSKI